MADNFAGFGNSFNRKGFEATRMVDANWVIKKKDDKEYEVQDGWVGHVLPFELVTDYLFEIRMASSTR